MIPLKSHIYRQTNQNQRHKQETLKKYVRVRNEGSYTEGSWR